MDASKPRLCRRFFMLTISVTALTFYIGCSEGTDIKPLPTPGSKIIIAGGSVKVRSPIGFVTETPTKTEINNSRRHVDNIQISNTAIPIPPNTTWSLEVKPTGFVVKSDDVNRRDIWIIPKTTFGPDPPDDPDGEGKEDKDKTDPTDICLTINGGKPQKYPFKKRDRVQIDYVKDK